ncbi:MAG: hypothetical protein JO316_09010 [Abitibacteriaceae bacterium]|nr:hypothetical protein [Abditibacteriaceae bacterium]MBV9865475.1 hypothetical protein [Abditibacteriaceae bacterium]
MQRKQSVKWWHLAVVTACALPVVSLIPGCGGGGGSNSIQTRQFTGNYTGTYTGSETGSFQYTIGSNKDIVATVISPSLGVLTGHGQIDNDGNFSFNGSDTRTPRTSYTFAGSYNLVGDVQTASGTWRTSNNMNGTFTATKAVGSPTPTPAPTFTPGPSPTPAPTATPSSNRFAGRYAGSITLNTTPVTTASLKFTIADNSSIGGFFRAPDNSTVNLAGSATSSTGAIILTGSFADNAGHTQTITLTGQLRAQNGATTVVNALARTSAGVTGTWAASKT